MPDEKKPEIAGALGDLDAALKAKYPTLRQKLEAPASASVLTGALGKTIPSELRALWAFCNGADSFFVGPGVDGMDFLDVEAAAEAGGALAESGADFPKGLVPFATDGAGNYVCSDAKGVLFDWDHETRKAKKLTMSLAALVAAIAKSAKSGKYHEGPELVGPPNAALAKLMKAVAAGKAGVFKIESDAEKLPPADGVTVLEAFVAAQPSERERHDALAKAYARAGRYGDALTSAARGAYTHVSTLFAVGEIALEAGAWADAEAAFTAIDAPGDVPLLGLALAQKRLGKPVGATLERAKQESAARTPLDVKSATSCYTHVSMYVTAGIAAAIEGDAAGARKVLDDAKAVFADVPSKGVKSECLLRLELPSAAGVWVSKVARHAGL